MADADPTMALIESLERANPSEWGRIVYGAPIFREHSVYQVTDGDGKKSLVVVPKGEKAPGNGECIHTVDKARLEQITEEINRNYSEGAKPIKLFPGHSNPQQPQTQNPEIVGFGRRAYMGTFGPHELPAIKSDLFYKLGHEDKAAAYPERSAEFNPRTNAITGVALLKTDPRLPMGMLAFASDHEVLYYGVGFMADENEKTPAKTDSEKPGDKPATKPADADDDELDDETSPAADEPEPFGEHEQRFASRMLAHYGCTPEALKHLGGEHKKYMETQAAMAQPEPKPGAASPTSGNLPGDKKKPKDDDKEDDTSKPKFSARIDMSQTAEERLNYAETRLAKLEEENAILYANEAIDALERQGKVIKDKPREVAKLVAMKTLEERQAHLNDIKLNYADAERSPARRSSWLQVDDGHPEGAKNADKEVAPISTADMLAYAEEHKIDMSTEAGVEKVAKALRNKA